MAYSEIFFKKQHRVPTIVTLLTIVSVLLILTKLVAPSAVPSKATKRTLPQVKIVNVSSSYATVFFETEQKEVGWIAYGEDKNALNKIGIDERDLQDKKQSYYYHYVNISGLSDSRDYFFQIVASNQLVGQGSGQPFNFKTTQVSSVANSGIAYGRAVKANGNALVNTPVLLTTEGGLALATLTKSTGEWLIPLGRKVGDSEKIAIDIYGEDKKKIHILTDGKHANPLPQSVIEGRDYTFLDQENVLGTVSSANLGKQASYSSVDIFFPKEGMIIDSARPLIKGIILPNRDATVTVATSDNKVYKITSDKTGVWNLNTESPWPPGKQKIVLTTVNEKGKKVQITRTFTIAKSGEQVMGIATGSATPKLTPSPTIVSPTHVPTKVASSSPTLILTLTKAPPDSGSSILPYALGSLSFIILGLGLMLAF